MLETLRDTLGPYGGALIIGFIGGIVPLVSIEVFIVAMALLLGDPWKMVLVAVLGTIGQMASTAVRYWAGRGVAKVPKGKRLEAGFQKAKARLDKWQDKPLAIIFISSLVGLPPFYFVAILAGTFKLSFRAIMIVGGAARLLRLLAVALAPLLF